MNPAPHRKSKTPSATDFTIRYIDAAATLLRQLEDSPGPSPTALRHREQVANHFRGEVGALVAGQTTKIPQSIRDEEGLTDTRALHFGKIEREGDTLEIVANGVIYFDQFVFQEYLSRLLGYVDTSPYSSIDDQLHAVLRELARMRPLAEHGLLILVPNPGFDVYKISPPPLASKPLFKDLAPALSPAIHLSKVINAVPFTTWTQIEKTLFCQFRDLLEKECALHPMVSREAWVSSLCIDVFREYARTSKRLPYLKAASIQDILVIRDRFCLFRESLKQFVSTNVEEGYRRDVGDLVSKVVQSLDSAVEDVQNSTEAQRKASLWSYCRGNLLTLLGLTPNIVVAILAAIGAITNSTLEYWLKEGVQGTDRRSPSPLVQGLFALHDLARQEQGDG